MYIQCQGLALTCPQKLTPWISMRPHNNRRVFCEKKRRKTKLSKEVHKNATLSISTASQKHSTPVITVPINIYHHELLSSFLLSYQHYAFPTRSSLGYFHGNDCFFHDACYHYRRTNDARGISDPPHTFGKQHGQYSEPKICQDQPQSSWYFWLQHGCVVRRWRQ